MSQKKTCTLCKQKLSVTWFYHRSKDGALMARCKSCICELRAKKYRRKGYNHNSLKNLKHVNSLYQWNF